MSLTLGLSDGRTRRSSRGLGVELRQVESSRAESRFESGVETEAIKSSWLSRGPGPRQARSRVESC